MNPIWIRATVLVCIFGAIVLVVEVLVRAFVESRAQGKAINLRLTMIGSGRSTGETLSLLRRAGSTVPQGLPPIVDRLARKLERTLMQAQVDNLTANTANVAGNASVMGNFGIGTAAPAAKLHVEGGNVLVNTAGTGVILKSPDGATCKLMTVSDAGAITLTTVTCP